MERVFPLPLSESFMENQDINVDPGSISLLIPPTRSGDDSAREQLMRELQQYLSIVARQNMDSSLRQKTGESDIIQQSFIRIIEKFDQFRGESSSELRAWIKTIVVNEINSVRRKFRTAKRDIGLEKTISPSNSTSPGLTPSDNGSTPSSAAMQAEQIRRFHEVLDQLSSEHAEVIRLRNIEKLAFKDVGEKMGRSTDAVSQLWYRAMLKFEDLLKKSGGFEDP